MSGRLHVSLESGFVPVLGDSFDLFDFGSVSGAFDTMMLPPLDPDLMWFSSELYSTGILKVTVAGDYNGDGTVNGPDYVVWRKGLGTIYTQNDYDVWRAHFGQSVGSAAAVTANTAVPEPATLVSLMFAATSWCLLRRRDA